MKKFYIFVLFVIVCISAHPQGRYGNPADGPAGSKGILFTEDFKVQTSIDGGVTWTDAITFHITGLIGPEKRIYVLNTPDVGSANFQFAFTIEGNEANIESISIDEVRLSPTAGVDVSVNEVILPQLIRPNDLLATKAIIQNLSVDSTSYRTKVSIRNSTNIIYSDSLSGLLQPGEVDTVTFTGMMIPEGEFSAIVTAKSLLDNNPLNDTVIRPFVAYKTYPRRSVVLEEATGTWCTYCPGASMGIEDLRTAGYNVLAIAYHGGDKYQTPEGKARLNYYPEITGYPTTMFDGVLFHAGGSHSVSSYPYFQPLVQQRLNLATPVEINLETARIHENTLYAKVYLASLSPIRNNNLVVHIVLTESKIPESWQDQDELNDVERMMVADSTGTSVDLSDKTETIDLQFNVSPGWVKENLRLIVFSEDLR